MSRSRIILADEMAEDYDEKAGEFVRLPKLEVIAKDRNEAKVIAEHIADKFGEKVELKVKTE